MSAPVNVTQAKLTAACSCGSIIAVEAAPPALAYEALRLFGTLHAGEGHDPVEPEEARRIMRRKREAA